MRKIEHDWIDGVECKWCSKCEQWLGLSCFGKGSGWDKLQTRCKECRKGENSKEQRKEYISKYYNERIEEIKEYNQNYYIEYVDEIKQQVSQYKIDNKSIINANNAKRKSMKLNQTPESADLKEIQFIYDVCAETNELLGGTYFHVDHIQPLSKDGLHHEDNLQILEAELNMEKNAKWPLTADEEIKYVGVTFNE